jgi:chemotaxis protein histidine kinase CheA
MTTLFDESALLQLSAVEADAVASEKNEEASSLKAEAVKFQAEAEELRAQAEADAVHAAETQTQADATEVDAAAEQSEAAAHAEVAATYEAVGDADFADGTADAAEAARIEGQAHGEEIGIAMCELVPLLDLLCDTLGGISAVGMEAGAAAEAAKASGEWMAAMAAKVEEERESALASELEAKATEDELLAAKLEHEVQMESERAEQEQAVAASKDEAAKVFLEESTEDEAIAGQESTTAMEHRAESANMSGQALFCGVLACWNAILAGVCAVVSFGYFFFNMIIAFVIPSVRQSLVGIKKITDQNLSTSSDHWQILRRDASYCFHHCAIFVVVAFFYHDLLENMRNNTLRARGGILLRFALSAACAQAFTLHFMPNCMSRVDTMWASILDFFRRMIVLPFLFLMEILFILLMATTDAFVVEPTRLVALMLAGGVAMTLGLHIIFFELPLLWSKSPTQVTEATTVEPTDKERRELDDGDFNGDESMFAYETHSLLPKASSRLEKPTDFESDNEIVRSPSWLALLWKEILMLQPLLEILVLVCMCRIMAESLGSVRYLWPTTKTVLIDLRPYWLVQAGIGIVALFMILCIIPVIWGG